MPEQQPDPEQSPPQMHPADPRLRRQLLLVLGLLLLLVIVYFGFLFAEIEQVREQATPDPSLLLQQLFWMSIGLVAMGAGLFIYLTLLALRVFSSGRFPPPGARVLRPTPIRYGWSARGIGLFGAVMGLAVLLASLYVYIIIGSFVGIDLAVIS